MDTRIIDVSAIEVNSDFNPREAVEDIEALGKEIKRNGQLVPITVVAIPANGKKNQKPFFLLAGERRLAAIKGLKQKTIRAQIKVQDEKGEEIELFDISVLDNMAREDLSPYEVGGVCVRYRDKYKLDSAQISRKLSVVKSMNKKNVDNYLRARDNLHKKILEAWKAKNGACTTVNLFHWASLEQAEQIERFEVATGKVDKKKKDKDKDKDKDNQDKQTRPSKSHIEKALAACKEYDQNDAAVHGATEALRFALGDVKTLKLDGETIYNPKAKKKVEDDEE